jgi:putative flippase GtrA
MARLRRLRRWSGGGRVRQLLRYSSVSLVSTVVGLSVLGALVATRTLSPGWANVVATAVGTVPSFELNRRWVWRRTGHRSLVREVGPFCVISFLGLAVSTLAVTTAARWAGHHGVGTTTRTAVVEAANVAAFGSLWVAQFLLLDRVLFRWRGPSSVEMVQTGSPGGRSLKAA